MRGEWVRIPPRGATDRCRAGPGVAPARDARRPDRSAQQVIGTARPC